MIKKHRVIHIITGLSTGGAEMMLYRLLKATDQNYFMPEVISLTDIGTIGEKIRSIGIPIRALGMKRGQINPAYLLKLVKWIRENRTDIVQTWMYHADLIGGIAGFLSGVPVVWGIHNSTLIPGYSKKITIWTAHLNAYLSQLIPKKIISCSQKAQDVHVRIGYDRNKMCLIPNGFDLTAFSPNLLTRQRIRLELNINDDEFLIGLIARFDPQKDHANFVKAAQILSEKFPKSKFLLCGNGVVWENGELACMIDSHGLKDQFCLLGRREDVTDVQNALDLATLSSSFGEAFPLVIGEAMACGVPCVVTDVGDSGYLVGEAGIVVPPNNPEALANAWREVSLMGKDARKHLGVLARKRVENNFSIDKITHMYHQTYINIIEKK
jgi:glycosyltransferase involved in cell wall biosynthesis